MKKKIVLSVASAFMLLAVNNTAHAIADIAVPVDVSVGVNGLFGNGEFKSKNGDKPMTRGIGFGLLPSGVGFDFFLTDNIGVGVLVGAMNFGGIYRIEADAKATATATASKADQIDSGGFGLVGVLRIPICFEDKDSGFTVVPGFVNCFNFNGFGYVPGAEVLVGYKIEDTGLTIGIKYSGLFASVIPTHTQLSSEKEKTKEPVKTQLAEREKLSAKTKDAAFGDKGSLGVNLTFDLGSLF
jgi:hypothetical protein